MWTRDRNLDEEPIQAMLQPIIQAAQLLQARKTDEDVNKICEMCNALSALQVCKILNLYTLVDDYEQRVPVPLIRAVEAKLKERKQGPADQQQNLLMDIKYKMPVFFKYNPSDICLEDIEIPECLNLPMLKKI